MPLQILDSTAHRMHGWRRFSSLDFASTEVFVPVALSEIASILTVCPLAIAKRSDGSFLLGALLGVSAGQNLFVDASGRWLGGYIPSQFRGHPFAMRRISAQDPRTVLCIDTDTALYCQKPDPSRGEERFFDDQGQLQPATQQVLNFLQNRFSQQLAAQSAVGALLQADVLQRWSWPAETPFPEGATPIGGLYRVDEARLNALEPQALASLRASGALALAYAQLFSMAKVPVLLALAKRRATVSSSKPVDLTVVQQAFDASYGDTMKFSF